MTEPASTTPATTSTTAPKKVRLPYPVPKSWVTREEVLPILDKLKEYLDLYEAIWPGYKRSREYVLRYTNPEENKLADAYKNLSDANEKVEAMVLLGTDTPPNKFYSLSFLERLDLIREVVKQLKKAIPTAVTIGRAPGSAPPLGRPAAKMWLYIQDGQARGKLSMPTYDDFAHDLQMGRGTISSALKELRGKRYLPQNKNTAKCKRTKG